MVPDQQGQGIAVMSHGLNTRQYHTFRQAVCQPKYDAQLPRTLTIADSSHGTIDRQQSRHYPGGSLVPNGADKTMAGHQVTRLGFVRRPHPVAAKIGEYRGIQQHDRQVSNGVIKHGARIGFKQIEP